MFGYSNLQKPSEIAPVSVLSQIVDEIPIKRLKTFPALSKREAKTFKRCLANVKCEAITINQDVWIRPTNLVAFRTILDIRGLTSKKFIAICDHFEAAFICFRH